MSAVPFDTLKYAEALKAAGVPEPQARAQAEALADVLRQGGRDLATKADIAELRTTIHALGLDLRREMAELKADLIKWNVGALIAMTGIFAAIVKLL